jgi:hypothetical protein
MPLISTGVLLARDYDAVVANPPYMGAKKGMNSLLKGLAGECYTDAKFDLFAMFIERGVSLAKPNTGNNAMVTMESWMFLSSYSAFRTHLLASTTLSMLTHMPYEGRGRTAMGISFGTSAFVLRNLHVGGYCAHFCFVQHTDLDESGVPHTFPVRNSRLGTSIVDNFGKVPGSPIAYWVSEGLHNAFADNPAVGAVATTKQGLATADNDRFLRYWHEVPIEHIGFGLCDRKAAIASRRKWFPYNKGGPIRKWYGNNEWVVNWENDGHELRNFRDENGKIRSRPQNVDYYFQGGITWSQTSSKGSSFRWFDDGFIIGHIGSGLYTGTLTQRLSLLGFLNSCVAEHLIDIVSPTMGLEAGHIDSLPFKTAAHDAVDGIRALIDGHREDFDESECSWDFHWSPLLACMKLGTLEESYKEHCVAIEARLYRMKELEEENNRHFVDIYGLQGELSIDALATKLTLNHPNLEEGIQRLISYAVGCMMGRYSVDKPGLIYASSGNKGFDSSQYITFPADQDGIVPTTDFEWFEDDAAKRFEEFVATMWPKEHLEDNMKFVAESLGAKSGESSRAIIRRYLATGFYKHHLSQKMYKNRPIYWLFSSGKQRAFQALVYLHRYNEGTLSRMRTEYVVPLLGKISARIGHLDGDITGTSGKHKRDLEKEQATLRKQLAELQEYDDTLRHYADQRIALDLDDGVKVNYAKFGDLLAEVKAVTGGTEED